MQYLSSKSKKKVISQRKRLGIFAYVKKKQYLCTLFRVIILTRASKWYVSGCVRSPLREEKQVNKNKVKQTKLLTKTSYNANNSTIS